jgi:hypothetical protein
LVYVLVAVVFLAFVVSGLMVATRRLRLSLGVCLVVSVAVPAAFTYATISTASPLWQGRYGIPFHMGVMLLAGMALEERRQSDGGPVRAMWLIGAGALALANALGIVHVLVREQRTSPLRGSAAWISAPAWMILVVVVAAFVAWAGAVLASASSESPDHTTPQLGGQKVP